jgi:hypothetical protein
MEWEAVNWFKLNQDIRHWLDFVNTVMNLRITLKAGTFLAIGTTVSLSSSSLLQIVCHLHKIYFHAMNKYLYNK